MRGIAREIEKRKQNHEHWIDNTFQAFEQENEDIWHLKKENKIKKNKLFFDRFFANSYFVQERLLNFPITSSALNLHASDFSYHIVDRTLRTNPVTSWWSQRQGGLLFPWFIGVDSLELIVLEFS